MRYCRAKFAYKDWHGAELRETVIFPGSTAVYGNGVLTVPNTVHNIEYMTIGVCVVYEDNGNIHHTGVLDRQQDIPGDFVEYRDRKSTKVLDKPEVWWKFLTRNFKACQANAD